MADTKVEFKYEIGDVTSAQRSRFLHSKQFKLIIAFWAISVVLMALSIYFPAAFPLFSDVTWTLIGQVSLIYLGTLGAILVIVPWLSFNFNRFWRLPLVFQFNTKSLRLSVAGKPGGLRLTWDQIRRVEGTERVFMVYYDDLQKHFILPRSAFKEQQSKRFLQMLARYAPQAQEQATSKAGGSPPAVEAGQPAPVAPADAAGFEAEEVVLDEVEPAGSEPDGPPAGETQARP